MAVLEIALLVLLAFGVVGGMGGIWLVRGRHPEPGHAAGRWLFIASLLSLGAGNFLSLSFATGCLLPFGLAAGWMVIGMLWEDPFGNWLQRS